MAGKKVIDMSDAKENVKIVNFADLKGLRNPFNTVRVARLDEYINKTIIIKDFKIDKGDKLDFVYILAIDEETGEEITLRTTSSVIEKQLQLIERYLREGIMVRATVKRVKRYLTLA